MPAPDGHGEAPSATRSAVLLAISALVIASPLRLLFAQSTSSPITWFIVWLALIAVAAVAVGRVKA